MAIRRSSAPGYDKAPIQIPVPVETNDWMAPSPSAAPAAAAAARRRTSPSSGAAYTSLATGALPSDRSAASAGGAPPRPFSCGVRRAVSSDGSASSVAGAGGGTGTGAGAGDRIAAWAPQLTASPAPAQHLFHALCPPQHLHLKSPSAATSPHGSPSSLISSAGGGAPLPPRPPRTSKPGSSSPSVVGLVSAAPWAD